jgi:type IV secretory pathway VirB2 component (pilin)
MFRSHGRGENFSVILCENTDEPEEEIRMIKLWRNNIPFKQAARNLAGIAVSLLLAAPAFAQGGNSPWENAVNVLMTAFTSTIARGLSLVAIVVAGLTFAFGEGGSKRVLAGVLFGVGMAIAAVNFLAWLFPGN